jgi:hypothetical protein
MSFTYEQEKVLAIIPKFSASFGIPSAIFIIHEIITAHKRKEGNPILRAIAGASVFQFLDAIGWFLSTWAVPKGSFAFAAGNQATCSFQGFLLQIVVGAPLYNCALAYFFFLVVQFDKSSEDLAKIEKYVHSFIITFAVGTSILLLVLDQYNHIATVCWIVGSPHSCGNSSFNRSDEDIPCDRGDWAWLYGITLFYGPLYFCIVLITGFNVSIYIKLRGTRDASWFAAQSILYAMAFFVTWAPSTIWSTLSWNSGGYFALDFVAAMLEPLGSFWNLLIFLRNRPSSRKKLWNILCCKFGEEEVAIDAEEDPLKKTIKTEIASSGTKDAKPEAAL